MKRIFSMKNWDILTRNKSLAMVATFGLFAVWLLLPDDLLKTMALHGFLWGSFSLSVIVMESADPQRVPNTNSDNKSLVNGSPICVNSCCHFQRKS